MAADPRLRVVLCWHMHQPDYRDHVRDEFLFPWVYLHAIKDYTDMAAHIEAQPGARAVVNFSPVLLEQLSHYDSMLQAWLKRSEPLRDPVLASLVAAEFPADADARLVLVKACLRANRQRQIQRFAAFARLVPIAEHIIREPAAAGYVSEQFLADLVTWYHLVWIGETVRRAEPAVDALIHQGSGFSLAQRRLLLQCIAGQIASLRDRYRDLWHAGRIELSTSPYAHPMVPLMVDFGVARESSPGVPLPGGGSYPGGTDRARWHIDRALAAFERFFGRRPAGCWPSEGGVSAATLALLEGAGFKWAATGENVLRSSLKRSNLDGDAPNAVFAPFQRPGLQIRLFARDDTLSDLIGFTYADWHADDAVANLVHRLEEIAGRFGSDPGTVVSIIMDGENAWEYYPHNGDYFLPTLYRKLGDHPRLRLCTYSELLEEAPARSLPEVVAGSWVYGTFSTWIGDKDKNQAWEVLGEAKRAYDTATGGDGLSGEHLERLLLQLASCEGSDWFWWYGDYNPEQTVRDFDLLYRTHLANVYQMLGMEAPEALSRVIAMGRGSPELGGVIRHGSPPGQ